MTYRNPARPDDESFALSFLEPDLVAVGDIATVRRAIGLATESDSITANAELMNVVSSLERGDAWAVGRLDALVAGGRVPPQLSTRLPAVTWVALNAQVESDIQGALHAHTRDEAAARDLRDVVRGFLALGNLQAGGRPEMQTVLQSLQLGGTGNVVTLSFRVPAAALDGVR
jgi:hypothetical protein